MDQDELTIVTDCENESDSINVTLSGIAEFTLTLTTESFSIFHDKDEEFLKPWIDFQEVFIDKVRNTQGILNSSGLIRGAENVAKVVSFYSFNQELEPELGRSILNAPISVV